jgi:hypothetical protein
MDLDNRKETRRNERHTTGRSKTRAVLTSRRPFDQEAKKTWQSTIADRFGEAVA